MILKGERDGAWEEFRGGIEDEYNQNTLHQILKELIKIFKKKKNLRGS